MLLNVITTKGVHSLTIHSPRYANFSCSNGITVKQSVSKEMNNDYNLKFA